MPGGGGGEAAAGLKASLPDASLAQVGPRACSCARPSSLGAQRPFLLTFGERRRQQDVLPLLALGINCIEYHCDVFLKAQVQDSVVSREEISIYMKTEGSTQGLQTSTRTQVALSSQGPWFPTRLTCRLRPEPATGSD